MFLDELLKLGFDEELAKDWMLVRKNKKATNSQTALNGFMAQVELSGRDKNEILRLCVEKSWSGFKAEWLMKDASKIDQMLNSYEIAKKNMGL